MEKSEWTLTATTMPESGQRPLNGWLGKPRFTVRFFLVKSSKRDSRLKVGVYQLLHHRGFSSLL